MNDLSELAENDIIIHQQGNLVKPLRPDNGLYAFRKDTGFDRVVLDCVTSLKHGAAPLDRDGKAQCRADRRHGE